MRRAFCFVAGLLSRGAVVYATAVMSAACDHEMSRVMPTQPTPPAPVAQAQAQPPVRPLVKEIRLNEVVDDDIERSDPDCITRERFTVPCRQFQLTAPAAGMLLARLSWDSDYTGMTLLLKIDEEQFTRRAPPWSPVEGRMKVVAGKTYRLAVGLSGSDLSGGPFRLTTTLE
jgi:hypothetical protein